MFTQCTNCQAIFRISMREVTVSKGFLRCGECHAVFDSSKNLSTTQQTPFKAVKIEEPSGLENLSKENLLTISALDDWQSSPTASPTLNQIALRKSPTAKPLSEKIRDTQLTEKNKVKNSKTSKKSNSKATQKDKKVRNSQKKSNGKLAFIVAVLLSLLLIAQIAFNYRHLVLDAKKYQPEKIQMLNHNVFAHPIEKNVLLISAAIENTATFDQPYPILEVSLSNSKGVLVALRRFSPEEYLDNYSPNILLPKNRATSIKLKIKDPGSAATRFQFDFL